MSFLDLHEGVVGVDEHAISWDIFARCYFVEMSWLDLMRFNIDPFGHASVVVVHLIRTFVLIPCPSFPHS